MLDKPSHSNRAAHRPIVKLVSVGAVGAALALVSVVASGCGSDDDLFGPGGGSTTSGTGAGTNTGGDGSGAGGSTTTGTGGSTSTGTGGAGQGGASQGGGSTGGSGTGGGIGCDGLGDPCSDCAAVECPGLYCNCAGSPPCVSFVVCLSNCAPNDAVCTQSCMTQNEDGISDAFLLGNCSAQQCPAQCPNAQNLDGCQTCLFAACEVQMNQCLANPECTELLGCIAACDPANLSCPQVCLGMHPGGTADAQAVQTCAGQSCPMCN